jgi:hypothetical protein
MKAIGWEEGRNIRFLFVWAEGRNERAPALAGELVAKNVDLIITFGTYCRVAPTGHQPAFAPSCGWRKGGEHWPHPARSGAN